uniref:uncharacterized protein LOC100181794 isoform X2 n=1 Tax=Ciona intestinalis TaxID=7719 RepID=UPI000EF50A4A|nr:uncharacterized protein LOC100181794 isoform X2 [Ciona intestinalis]|eukprot:XP_026693561.1 uncharacterized protein LOC100181794 isoform X2 [Ciona intestinalis]
MSFKRNDKKQEFSDNFNNNHNSSENSPSLVETDEMTTDEEAIVWQESRQVVDAYLKRSLSQNAKSSLTIMKPEGYHKLKKDGRLPFYQRQQSRPEQGSLVRTSNQEDKRHRSSVPAKNITPKTTLPSRSSMNELSSHGRRIVDPLYEVSRSVTDINDDIDMPIEDGIMKKLIDSEHSLEYVPSSDSLPSTSGEGNTITRRKSFTKATRKSVISMIENQKRRERQNSSYQQQQQQQQVHFTSKTPDPIRKTLSVKSRKSSLGELHYHEFSKEEQDGLKRETGGNEERKVVEKKISFRDRMKRIMGGPSNKKKLRYKNSFKQRQTSVEENKKSADKSSSGSNQGFDFGSSSSKQPSRERTPSPSKMKGSSTPNVLRSLSMLNRSSPKMKRQTMPTSTSSSSFAAYSTLETNDLSKTKSGSLPSTARLGVNFERNESMGRRHSTDLSPKSDDKRSSPARPQHLDLHKKQKGGKLRKLFKFMRRRHDSESSNSSRSLPSIPAAVEDEAKEARLKEPTRTVTSQSKNDDVVDGESPAMSLDGDAPYHHRGSLSFSSGDLDRLSVPERQEIYDEIAETLQRIAEKYNRHVQSRSSTPGSRLVTPESSFSSQDYRIMKAKSDPVTRQSSGSSTQSYSVKKSFRKYKDDSQRALTAYMNMSAERSRTSRTNVPLSQKLAAKMPRQTPVRRHTHHTQTGSFDSPYNKHKVSLHRASDTPAFSLTRATNDVVDGKVPSDVTDNGDSTKPDEDFHPAFTVESASTAGKVPAGDVLKLPRRYSESPTRHGSDVDDPSYFQQYENQASAGTSRRLSEGERDIDEDKLVNQLVQALIEKGEYFTDSIDLPATPASPAFRDIFLNKI